MRKIKKLALEIQHHRIKFWKWLYTLKWTMNAMRLLPRYHSLDVMKMSINILKSCIAGVKTVISSP